METDVVRFSDVKGTNCLMYSNLTNPPVIRIGPKRTVLMQLAVEKAAAVLDLLVRAIGGRTQAEMSFLDDAGNRCVIRLSPEEPMELGASIDFNGRTRTPMLLGEEQIGLIIPPFARFLGVDQPPLWPQFEFTGTSKPAQSVLTTAPP